MSLSKHERVPAGKEEHLTPPNIINALGGWNSFDLDPCMSIARPFQTARNYYSLLSRANKHFDNTDGLELPWFGRVWLNPPYGNKTGIWMDKLTKHGNGIALIYARTETTYWHPHIWKHADSFFWFQGRLKFFDVRGIEEGPAGGPSVLVAYGKENDDALQRFAWLGVYSGHYLPNRKG